MFSSTSKCSSRSIGLPKGKRHPVVTSGTPSAAILNTEVSTNDRARASNRGGAAVRDGLTPAASEDAKPA